MTSLDHKHLEVINRCDVETSSGLFVFKDRIVCVCVCELILKEKKEGKKAKQEASRDIYIYI